MWLASPSQDLSLKLAIPLARSTRVRSNQNASSNALTIICRGHRPGPLAGAQIPALHVVEVERRNACESLGSSTLIQGVKKDHCPALRPFLDFHFE